MNTNEKRNIGLFFDGRYFYIIYNYYYNKYKTLINIDKFIDFIRYEISSELKISMAQCEVNVVHFFIGGIAREESEKHLEEALMKARIGNNIHRSALRQTTKGFYQEKGVDVNLAIEALDDALHKKYDILVLVTGDSDFVPLVSKIKELNIPVYGVCWDNPETDTQAHQDFLDIVTKAWLMNEELKSRTTGNPFVSDILQSIPLAQETRSIQNSQSNSARDFDIGTPQLLSREEIEKERESVIIKMIEPARDFGFIRSEQKYFTREWNNYNFSVRELQNRRKEELVEGMRVKFCLAYDSKRSSMQGVPLYKAVNIAVLD
ncbi:MAG: NYN domain-containing protein [Spirochaetaceae bacterium]|jgi:uncharacterized LabA/DUF88 family protein|nr:NYN domain-containing protein [Spirochaetaceae bacterium]